MRSGASSSRRWLSSFSCLRRTALEPPTATRRKAPGSESSRGGATRCARGGKYAFWIRRGDPKKLLVFFQGGGGCFDERTCAPGSLWFDDRVDASDDPRFTAGGILELEHSDNPFRDYSIVYIPSCTGDVHTGTRVVKYGALRVQQKGFFNARAALARAYREFPSPRTVFVTGCSAGSVGSAFHADSIIKRYPRARVAQVGDSLSFVYHRPISLAAWGTHTRFPPWFKPTRPEGRWTMTEFVTALAKNHPRRTLPASTMRVTACRCSSTSPSGGRANGFEPRLRTAERTLKKLPNYRSYLACGTQHCAFDRFTFYSITTGGIRLRDWVADLANGRNVECPECKR